MVEKDIIFKNIKFTTTYIILRATPKDRRYKTRVFGFSYSGDQDRERFLQKKKNDIADLFSLPYPKGVRIL